MGAGAQPGSSEYHKDFILVEVAYNWRTAESPEGQREFLDEVHRVVLNTPGNRGKGIFWWEPAVPLNQKGIYSRGILDNEGNALPVINVFDKWTRR